MNFVEARLTGSPDDIWVDADGFRVQVPEQHRKVLTPHLDKEVFFGIRPEDLFDPKYSPPDITTTVA